MWDLETGRFSFRAPRSARLTPALQTGRLVLGRILSCPAAGPTPQSMLYPFWALVGDSIPEALSVCWPGQGIPEELRRVMPKMWASLGSTIPFSAPLHFKYSTQDTSTEMLCTLCAWSHTFMLSDKCQVYNLSSVYTHMYTSIMSPLTPLLSHSQFTEYLLYTLHKYSQ